jgi:hypothetical protein
VVGRPRTTWKIIEWALQKVGKRLGKKAKGLGSDKTKWKCCMKAL